MLPVVLVFLFAQCALSFPTANVIFYDLTETSDITETSEILDDGYWINRNVTTWAFEHIDTGDIPLYSEMVIKCTHDLASLRDPTSQATAAAQIISIMGELATGVPGDSCHAAALINASVSRHNYAAVLDRYIKHNMHFYIDVITRLVNDPNGVRYSAGLRGYCFDGGRNYQFDEAWDSILSTCNKDQAGILNEQYCAAGRLYTAFSVRSNNVAAAVLAATIPEVVQIHTMVLGPLADFLRVVGRCGNPAPEAHILKNAMLQARAQMEC